MEWERLKLWLPGDDLLPQPRDPGPHEDADESLSPHLAPSKEEALLDVQLYQPDDEDPIGAWTQLLQGIAVPFTRILRPGMRGADVVAYKRTLSRAGYMQWGSFTDYFGPNMAKAVSKYRHVHGLGTAPSIGPKTHASLVLAYKKGSRSIRAMDARSRQILQIYHDAHTKSRDQLIREAIVAEWHFLWLNRYSMPYAQLRPVPLVKPPDFPRLGTDCSGHVMLGYFVAGAKNPNFFGDQRMPYNGQGYTGTIMAAGKKCARSDLELGDVVFYGYTQHASPAFPVGSPTHVAGYIGGGRVSSNGSHPMREDNVTYRGDINSYYHLEV